ncbi:Uncharacterized conserved protein [Sphingobium sp. YR657]|uniref:SphA family protein n=1 Tax=Sphingobium sp. YR657 TaxID=1884366 RepID=UPI000913896C|nr:transporter [Sphingobium sp. YR657]SHM44458.1 Uncharacterized conserved protein [Sphingobium sp. YR657]
MRPYPIFMFSIGCALFAADAHATEGGGGAYPNGAESLMVAPLPPPGTYLLNYTNYYTADRLNDAEGNSMVPDFSLDAYAQVSRFVHVTDKKILGATWAMQAFVPLVSLTVHAGGARDSRFGLGDMIVTPVVLGWKAGNTHITAAVDTWVPTGKYNRENLANIGRNTWNFEPVLAMTYLDPAGKFDLSLKLMYDFSTKNKATDYQSGQEFHTDFAAGVNLKKLTLGVNGYYYKQTTGDKQGGLRVGTDGFKGEAFALGPVVRYQAGKIPISFQWQHEFMAHNKPQGDKFWLKSIFRF